MNPGPGGNDEKLGKRALLAVAVVAIVIGSFFFYRQQAPTPPAPAATPPARPAPVTPPPTPADNPPAEAPEAPALPSLDHSDAVATEQLVALFGKPDFGSMFHPDELIRHITATVDNLPRDKVAMRLRPLKTMDSQFVADGKEGEYTLGSDNYARYAPYIKLVETLDPDAAVKAYVALYPLFQQAYAELGNPEGYFNDRVVEVIDNLLAAPDLKGPIPLVRPSVMYKFADPGLESLSAGQKLLLRMGPDNAARVKAKLKAVRDLITASPPGGD